MHTLLEKIKNLDITILVEGNNLKLGIPERLDCDDIIEEIKENKTDLIKYIQEKTPRKRHKNNNIEVGSNIRLTPAQKRLYVLNQLAKDSVVYNIPQAVEVQGYFDIDVLEKAITQLIQRHEILRTNFVLDNNNIPTAIVQEEFEFSIKFQKTTENQLPEVINQFVRPFDLSNGPLLRACLILVDGGHFVFAIDMHHIITDGVAQQVFIKELLDIYNGEALLDKPIQFKEYVNWYYSSNQQNSIANQKSFWLQQLSGFKNELNLPADFKITDKFSFKGASIDFKLGAECTKKLTEFAKEYNTSLFIVLLSIYGILLSKMSQVFDIVIGTPVANRTHPNFQKTIGMFVNTLAIRIQPRSSLRFKDYLKNVSQKVLQCFDNQEYVYEELIKDLDLNRTNKINPLFNVLISLNNFKETEIKVNDSEAYPFEIKKSTAKFDLSLHFKKQGEKLGCVFEYRTDLFKQSTVENYFEYFKNIIEQVITNDKELLKNVSLLNEQQTKRLVTLNDRSNVDYPKESTVTEIFEQQAVRFPDRIALVDSNVKINYKTLNERANQIAWELKEKGVGRDTIVGLFMEKSFDIVAAMLGILKAGGAYLPIDVNYPKQRIDYLIENSNINLILSTSSCAAKLNHITESILLLGNVKNDNITNPPNINQSSDLCYIIYTSGTTGNPKGVMVEHGNLISVLFNDEFPFEFSHEDIWTMFHSTSFDFSVWEIYGALLYGGKLVIIPSEVARNPIAFKNVLKRHKVTVLNQTPTAFYNLIHSLKQKNKRDIKGLRYVIFGGEELTPNRLLEWHLENPKTQLINMYGITETAIHVTFKRLDKNDMSQSVSNIGKPLPTRAVYLLDSNMKVVPEGSIGEIFVGGSGVARGYLNNTELTVTKFVKNPFIKNQILYRSGDLARIRSNGELEYLGRNDRQVQIKGYRIELGEVEYQLEKHSSVKQAVVMARYDDDYPALCAYVIPEENFDEDELRKYLHKILPHYMIPNFFVSIDKVPYTQNFKIDFEALPIPGNKKRSNYITPQNQHQKIVAEIWAKYLPTTRVGLKDNFFFLGGDSMRALSVISEINKELDISLEIADIYTYQSLEELCTIIPERPKEDWVKLELLAKQKITAFQENYKAKNLIKENYEVIYPMNGIEKGMVFHSIEKRGRKNGIHDIIYHEQNIYELPFDKFDQNIFKKTIALLIKKHAALRKIFDLEYLAHIILKEVDPELNFVDISDLPAAEQESFIIGRMDEEKLRATELDLSLFWRMTIFKVSEVHYYLLFDFHHSLFDGWSLSTFLTEFHNTYLQLQKDNSYTIEPLKTTYEDQITTEIAASFNEESLTYWKDELKDFERIKFHKLQNDHEYRTHVYELGSDLRKKLEKVAVQNKTNLKHLCFMAYLYMMKIFTGMDDLTVGLVTNNRPLTIDGERLLGCFLNTIPFRIRFQEKDISWKQYIRRVENKLKVFKKHDKIPFFEILNLIDERKNSNNPIFEASFNFINFHIYEELIETSLKAKEETGFLFKNYMNNNTIFDVIISAHNSTLNFVLIHSSTVINDKISSNLFEYFKKVLYKFLEEVETPVLQNEILTDTEITRLLGPDLNPDIRPKEVIPIIQLFDKTAERFINQTAIVAGENTLTYLELKEKSKRLAQYLIEKKGVKAGEFVGLKLNKSEHAIIALLGILYTGACYVPIDPLYPQQRINYIENDSGCKEVIDEEWMDTFNNFEPLSYTDSLKCQAFDNVYMIYTSGSTGQPKGVAINNSNLSNYLSWALDYYKGSLESYNFPLFTSLSFDLTQTSIWLTLLSGGELHIYDSIDLRETMKNILSNDQINTLKLTPAHVQVIDEYLPTHIQNFILGGEVLLPSHVNKIKSISPFARIYNEYGPTEATIGCTCEEVILQNEQQIISIGKPIANTRVYILDNQNQLTPHGIVGELCVSGYSVSNGYHNQPELTDEKFILDPYSEDEIRMYKTGDLARWNSNGTLELVGRKDDQVKVRGYRIELGEINAIFDKGKLTEQHIVLVNKDSQGNNTLAAYVIPKEDKFDINTLKDYLSQALPNYMIPDSIIILDEFPLTNNGKIDKEALLQRRDNVMSEIVSPRNEVETMMLKFWKESLGKDEISIHANFFELGGHSLTAIVLLNKIQREFNVKVPLEELFNNSTIATLSSYILFSNNIDKGFIEPAPELEFYPLSSIQRRQYFVYQIYKDSLLYNIPINFSVTGSFDIKRFEETLNKLLKRHHILRTCFGLKDGNPVQWIKEETKLEFKITDVEESDVDTYINNFVRPFDLAKEIPLRVELLKIPSGNYVLLTDMHHIVFDEISRNIILNEMLEIFNGAELASPRLQYKDYAVWQNGDYYKEMIDKHKDYWMKVYEEKASTLELPTDFPRPLELNDRAYKVEMVLEKEFCDRIRDLVLSENTSMFNFLMATYNILLSKLSSQDDIGVGITISGRQHADLEDIVGMFVNTLALRNRPKKELKFNSFLSNVHDNTVKSFDHQFYPYEDLIDELKIARVLNRNPLFDVFLAYSQKIDETLLKYPDFELEVYDLPFKIAKFDITLEIVDSPEEVELRIIGHQDLFKEATLERFLKYFHKIIEQVVENPEIQIKDIDILPKEEKEQLHAYNQENEIVEKSVVELFAEQAKNTPDNDALVFNNDVLTYQELDKRSNQLARHLESKGIEKGDLVGISIDRSLDTIISFLAILKIGAAYLPIDVTSPSHRIDFILKDANIKWVLSTSENESRLRGLNCNVIALDNEWENISTTSDEAIDIKAKPDDLMYVIYTSGSTGHPKGVMLEHRSLVNMSLEQIKRFNISEKDRVLQFAALTFDASVSEILMTLLSGAALVLVEKDKIDEGELLINYMQEQQVSVVTLPPAYLRVINRDKLTFLRCIITAGEPANVEDAQLLSKQIEYYNAYGPTECAVCISTYKVDPKTSYSNQIPIGNPLNNLKVYVLDQNNKLCPIGVPGELCVSGVGVARGYLNRSELTKEKFVSSPLNVSERMYRTGDYVKWNNEGQLEFIGRKDDQVKIRGFRIELGEIESVLNECDLIKQVSVQVVEKGEDNKNIIAYIVPNGDYDSNNIYAYMGSKLPAYMIPSHLVAVKNIPLTSHGKVDKEALVKFGDIKANIDATPKGQLEIKVAGIWKNILGIDEIGVENNFFEIGGNSLLAIRIVETIKTELNCELSVKDIFIYPTIRGLCRSLALNAIITEDKPIVKIQDKPEKLPLSYYQEFIWIIDKLTGSKHYHIPIVQLFGAKLDVQNLEKVFREIIKRHEPLRTIIKERDEIAYQEVLSHENWEMEMDELDEDIDKTLVQQYISEEINRPFNLYKDYRIRACLFKVGTKGYVLVMTMHHIAADAQSLNILVREFLELSLAYSNNRAPNLPPILVEYSDYALWQREYLSPDVLENKLIYWENKLKGVQPIQLPYDYSKPKIRSIQGASFNFKFNKSLSDRINDFCNTENITPFIFLLSAFKALLHRYSGQDDICVGTPISSRRKEVENLIGFFINTVAIRTNLSDNPSFSDLLNQMKENVFDVFEQLDTPIHEVIQRVVEKTDPSTTPLFQVLFHMQNISLDFDSNEINRTIEATTGKLPFTREDIDNGSTLSKFDLTMNISNREDRFDLDIEYCTDLFKASTIRKLAQHYQQLIEEILIDKELKIGQYNFLSDEETILLLEGFNADEYNLKATTTIIEQFENQAKNTPSNLAIVCGDKELTYSQLYDQSKKLAYYLQKEKQIRPGDFVGIKLERNEWSIISLLAVMQARACYVPIDPNYPEQRIRDIEEDSQCKEILDKQWIDAYIETEQDYYFESEQLDYQMSDNVYLIYTSGSTGKPKGIPINNNNLANYVEWAMEYYRGDLESYNFPFFTSLSFDLTQTSILLTLLSGGKLFIYKNIDPLETMREILANPEINTLKLTPSHLQIIEEDTATHIKNFILGGEALLFSHIEKLKTISPNVKVFNEYGPTEVTIGCTCAEITSYNPKEAIPIGRPIANTQVYILDEQNQLVPQGIVGELCISSEGVTEGYLNRFELNQQKFVINPYSKGDKQKMYRTGDLARWNIDGQLELIGRKDDQVKIRGYRIELGEVNSHIDNSRFIAQSVTLAKPDHQGNNILVSYIVPRIIGFDNNVLQEYLRGVLPQYMIPDIFIELEELPLTQNGKVDKERLLQRKISSADSGAIPRNDVESMLAEIWKEILNIDDVGIYDNFFELGGHSLLAIKLILNIDKIFSTKLNIENLIDNPTIESLSKLISLNVSTNYPLIVRLNSDSAHPNLFCIPAVSGDPMTFLELSRLLDESVSLYSFQALGLDGISEPHATIQEMALAYIEKMLNIDPIGPFHLLGYSLGSNIAYEMLIQLQQRGYTVDKFIIVDTLIPQLMPTPEFTNHYELLITWFHRFIGEFDIDRICLNEEELVYKTLEEKIELMYQKVTDLGIDIGFLKFKGHIQVGLRMYTMVYKPDPDFQLDLPLTLFATNSELGYYFWDKLATKKRVRLVPVSGEHHTVLDQPNVGKIGDEILSLFSQ